MPVKFVWLLKNRVRLVQFTDALTLADIKAFSEAHTQWLAEVQHDANIHYIIDFSQISTYPRSIVELQRAIGGKLLNTGWIVLITEDFFLRHLLRLFGRLLNFETKVSPSVKDAYLFLQEVDEIDVPDDWDENLDDTQPQR